MSIPRLVAAVLFIAAPLLTAQSATTTGTDELIHKIETSPLPTAKSAPTPGTHELIHKIETCLPPPVVVKGEPPACTPLLTRMQQLHIQGVSIAVVHHGVIEWARGYGIATPD